MAQTSSYQPIAHPDATVTRGDVRVTILTPRFVRLELSADGQFEDRASYAFVNRRTPVPQFTVEDRDDGWTVISTDVLTVEIHAGEISNRINRPGKKPAPIGFNDDSLRVTILDVETGKPRTLSYAEMWAAHRDEHGNLGGTYRTLDGVSGSTKLEPGVLSRDGWVLIDDSDRIVFDNSDWPWAVSRETSPNLDFYFLYSGRDYKQALADFALVAGDIPLPPHYVFGAWWSRYWAYSDQELRELVGEFRAHDVPLDVLVVDMDWHLDGWTGYTWNPDYFPDPEGFLDWTEEQGLRVPLNLHPADGVGKHEAAFEDMARALGEDSKKIESIEFDCTDKAFVEAYFKYLHHPLEAQGVDFWWMDWQQGRETDIAGLDPLPWLNYLHWSDWERDPGAKEERPLIFSRWGGLGNHRYQVGFSGDTFCDWQSLAYQPYFTSTAANVGYGYWSHDIGGHQPGMVDPELYTRWIQFGVFSPVIRTHTTKNPLAERRIWKFPDEAYDAMKDAWRLRYALLPYTYTQARRAHDTAISLCRPLYYDWPEEDAAYDHPEAYMFGDDLYVAPVCEPRNPRNRVASVEVWLPPGNWTNWCTGRVFDGRETVVGRQAAALNVPLGQIPLFVREGAIIPAGPVGKNSDVALDPLTLHIFGGDECSTRVYEDDGVSQGYLRGAFTWQQVSSKRHGDVVEVTIAPPEGSFAGQLRERAYEIVLHDVPSATTVLLNGEPLAEAKSADEPGYGYRSDELATVIRTPKLDTGVPATLRIELSDAPAVSKLLPRGLRGYLRLLREIEDHAGDATPELVRKYAGLGEKIAEDVPSNALPGAELLAADLEEDAVNLAAAVYHSDIDEPYRTEYVTRLLGLFARFDLLATDAPQQYEAKIDVLIDPPLGRPVALEPEITFESPSNWETIATTEMSVALDDQTWLEQRSALLKAPEVLQTAQMKAVVKIWPFGQAGEHVLMDATETTDDGTTITKKVTVSIEGQKDAGAIVLPIERTLLPSINAWWVVGPFEQAQMPELDEPMSTLTKVNAAAKYEGKDDKTVGWKRVVRTLHPHDDLSTEFFVNFTDVFGGRVYDTVAYVVTFIESPREMDAVLRVGSDDGVVVWLNGEEVHRNIVGRAYQPKQDEAPLPLKAGRNVLVLRIDQGGGDWGFGAHIETAAGAPIPELEVGLE